MVTEGGECLGCLQMRNETTEWRNRKDLWKSVFQEKRCSRMFIQHKAEEGMIAFACMLQDPSKHFEIALWTGNDITKSAYLAGENGVELSAFF